MQRNSPELPRRFDPCSKAGREFLRALGDFYGRELRAKLGPGHDTEDLAVKALEKTERKLLRADFLVRPWPTSDNPSDQAMYSGPDGADWIRNEIVSSRIVADVISDYWRKRKNETPSVPLSGWNEQVQCRLDADKYMILCEMLSKAFGKLSPADQAMLWTFEPYVFDRFFDPNQFRFKEWRLHEKDDPRENPNPNKTCEETIKRAGLWNVFDSTFDLAPELRHVKERLKKRLLEEN